jgi:hypothetical protein
MGEIANGIIQTDTGRSSLQRIQTALPSPLMDHDKKNPLFQSTQKRDLHHGKKSFVMLGFRQNRALISLTHQFEQSGGGKT